MAKAQKNKGINSASSLGKQQRVDPLLAVGGAFVAKVVVGCGILLVSARQLDVSAFADFSQLFIYLALVSSMASGGVQNGVTREIAAISGDQCAERIVVLGGMLVWAWTSLLVTIGVVTLHRPISLALFGDDTRGALIVQVTLLAQISGIGTILCSALAGSGRASLGLLIQSVGITMGGATCIVALFFRDGTLAVLLYVMGSLLSASVAIYLSRKWLMPFEVNWAQVRQEALRMLQYSFTFLVVVSALPIVLIVVRFYYRVEFGVELLGYWLLANRASDVTTQIVNMYLGQIYLPKVASEPCKHLSKTLMWKALFFCTSISALGALLFGLVGKHIIMFGVSERFLPAFPFILGYLVGDVFRVGGNLALYTALAARRLRLVTMIEVALAMLVGLAISSGIALGQSDAPYFGYILAHLVALVISLFFLNTAKGHRQAA